MRFRPRLSSWDRPQSTACIGIQIAPQHILVQLSCVEESDTITIARRLDIQHGNLTSLLAPPTAVDVTNTTTIDIRAKASPDQHQNRLRIFTLESALPSYDFEPVIFPLRTPYPAPFSVDANATLVYINIATMRVSVIHQVIYLDGSRCQHAVCALPLDVEARKVFTGPTSWSFLLQHDVAQGNYRLLGLGGSEGTNTDGIWGFSWLPQLLTSSVLRNNGVHDVQTVTVAHKEVAGDPVDDDKATFIAGFLETEDSQTSCTGTVVASRYVLTAASCFKRGDFKWIILDRLDTFGESGERIKIKKKIPHPHHVDGTHWYDFMLVELEKPTSRTPIGFVDTNTTFTEGTVFGYGELIDRYGRYYQTYELRAADTKLLTLPQCVGWMDVEMDETMMCVGGKLKGALCTGDNGGPVVVTTENKTKLLYALVTVGGDCGRTSLYGIVSVVFSVADWIHAHLDQKTCLNGRTTRLTGTRRLILA